MGPDAILRLFVAEQVEEYSVEEFVRDPREVVGSQLGTLVGMAAHCVEYLGVGSQTSVAGYLRLKLM